MYPYPLWTHFLVVKFTLVTRIMLHKLPVLSATLPNFPKWYFLNSALTVTVLRAGASKLSMVRPSLASPPLPQREREGLVNFTDLYPILDLPVFLRILDYKYGQNLESFGQLGKYVELIAGVRLMEYVTIVKLSNVHCLILGKPCSWNL